MADEYQLSLVRQYLATHGHRCPMCNDASWTFTGVEVGNQVSPGGGIRLGGGAVVPRANLVCNSCGFVASYAWKRILAETGG
ncbi:MAG TPA: hypothetical protein VHO25_02395 [Polyangiaceae bacterium]|nr:hypothetical protein [Polyangiaceae bacterium]